MTVWTYKIVIVGLVLTVLAYAGFFSLPILSSLGVLGIQGRLVGDRFRIERVIAESPAAVAGIRPSDEMLEQDGLEPAAWHLVFANDRGTYLAQRATWLDGTPVGHRITRGDCPLELELTPHQLDLSALVGLHAPRLLLSLFLLGLALFLVLSAPAEKTAFLASLGFCLWALWLVSGVRFWSGFMAPYISAVTLEQFLVIRLLSTFALLAALSLLAHFSLLFPVNRTGLPGRRLLLPGLYFLPPLIVLLVLGLADGTLAQRLTASYRPVQLIVALYCGFATTQLVYSYIKCPLASERERSRWVVAPLVGATTVFLGLWSLPKLLFGHPLLANYDWLLLPFSLVPMGMTLAIDRHHLFGISGIIRRRISILQRRLEREQRLGRQKDHTIQALLKDVRELEQELGGGCQPEPKPPATRDRLARLEQRYPQLTKLREQQLVSESPLWEQVFEELVLAAQGWRPVLIFGESGTGKTDLARAVHQLAAAAGRGPGKGYREVSCAQFEHSDPAFALGKIFGIGKGHGLSNVAAEGQPGLLAECDGGTLFLDDVDRLPLNVQDLLLYPLEGKAFEPGTGSGPPRLVTIKFVFASNRNLEELSAQGRFRGDVLARMSMRITVPPLRARREDIPGLVDRFVAEAADELGHALTSVAPGAMSLLLRCPWSAGNARELGSQIHRALGRAKLANDSVLRPQYLAAANPAPDSLTGSEPAHPSSGSGSGSDPAASAELAALRRHGFKIKPASRELGLSEKARTLSNHLRGICISALAKHQWALDDAANEVVGCERSGSDPSQSEMAAKVRSKMQRFLRQIESNVNSGTETKLFQNLPNAYHESLHQAIERVRPDQTGHRK